MNEKDEENLHSIGSYARHLGVTPDFLKHYERYHLVTSETQENGYRYYPFAQTFRLMECLKLRNLSVPVREMDMLLNHSSLDEVTQYMEDRTSQIRRQIRFQETVLREYGQFTQWLHRMENKKENWTIVEDQEFFFLPHTQGRRFLEDPRIYDILGGWTDCMPIVKSCMQFETDASFMTCPKYWGFIVPQADALALEIPVNDVVEHVHIGKAIMHSFAELPIDRKGESRLLEHVFSRMRAMHLIPYRHAYKTMFMSTHIDTAAQHYGFYLIPFTEHML